MDQAAPNDVTNSGKKKRLTVEQRRAHVKLEILINGNVNISNIATKLGCGRKTIKDDIDVMMAENEFWQHNMAAVGWMTNVKEMYADSQIEIAKLKNLLDGSYVTEIKTIVEKEGTSEQKITTIQKMAAPTELATLHNALTGKRKFIAELMSRRVLYERTQEYAKFFQEHSTEWKKFAK